MMTTTTIDDSTMLVQLTVGQLRGIIDERVRQATAERVERPVDDRGPLLWGIKALADFLGCSVPHASAIANSERYTDAIFHPEGSRRIAFFPERLKVLLHQRSQEKL